MYLRLSVNNKVAKSFSILAINLNVPYNLTIQTFFVYMYTQRIQIINLIMYQIFSLNVKIQNAL